MKTHLFVALAGLVCASSGAWSQTVGEEFTYNDMNFVVTGQNLVTNPSFDDGVDGWFSGNWNNASISNYTWQAEGGFNGGAYLQYSAGGAGADSNIRNRWSVERGKSYLFRCYTSGKAPDSNNTQYSFLATSDDGTTEGTKLYLLDWGVAAAQTSDSWTENTFVFTATTDYVLFRSSWTGGTKLDEFFLGEVERSYTADQFGHALELAWQALEDEAYANVKGAERGALVAAIKQHQNANSALQYKEGTIALEMATAEFIAAKPDYDALALQNERAEALGLKPYTVTNNTTAADIPAIVQEMKVAEFAAVEEQFPYDLALGSWTTTGSVKNEKSQHWSGDAATTYNEPNYWGNSAGGSATWRQEMTLPAGTYVLKVAGRRSTAMALTASVLQGETVLASAADFPPQGTGRGIAMDGTAEFSDGGSYANDGTGWGFEWRFLQFTLTDEAVVTIAFSAEATTGQQWASFCDYVVKAKNQRSVLMQAITVAKAANLAANVGTGAFQKDVQDVVTYWDFSIRAAEDVYRHLNASAAEISNAIEELNSNMEKANGIWDEAPLNAPKDGQLFHLVLTYDGYQYDNHAVTFIANGRNDAGNYNIQYKAEPNTNLAQAFTFTQNIDDEYYLSQVDADGVVRYVCTGTVYGGDDRQLRTTTNADEAALFQVIATRKDGVYKLFNIAANMYVGSQDVGFYTVDSHTDFRIEETAKATVNINTKGTGWGTVILPFAADIPAGLTAYAVEAFDGANLTMSEVESLEANKPYLLMGSVQTTLTGDAQGTNLTYTDGLLTGVYAETVAPAGSYVKQGSGFALVAEGDEVSVAANQAYLTYSGETAPEVITAIKSLAATSQTSNATTIYNLAGQQVSRMQKGVYVVNGTKVAVK